MNQSFSSVEHPSSWIESELVDALRRTAAEAEADKDLHAQQWRVIHDKGWLKMLVPPRYGGLGWSLIRVLETEECLSWVDGSVGWVVTLCSGAAWFVGFIDPYWSEKVFREGKVCIAGSGSVTGTAELHDGEYTINGFWKYASGATHASFFTANCEITRDNVRLHRSDGSPVIQSFLFKRDEVTIHRTWNAMGMKATGSHSFEVRNMRVASNRTFRIDQEAAVIPEEIYRFPFRQLAEATLSVNLSGMAIRFVDCCEELASADQGRVSLRKAVGEAKEKIHNARVEFYQAVGNAVHQREVGILRQSSMGLITETSRALTNETREQLSRLYPHTGLRSADEATELNRIWRNFHTAGQHGLFQQ